MEDKMKKKLWVKPNVFRLFSPATEGKPTKTATAEFITATSKPGGNNQDNISCDSLNNIFAPYIKPIAAKNCVKSDKIVTTYSTLSAHVEKVVSVNATLIGPS